MQSTRHAEAAAHSLKSRVAFVEIDSDTLVALDAYRPALVAALPGILREFYAHIAKWPNLVTMFKDGGRMDYARSAQEKHWNHLFEARFDQAYEDSVRRIGLIHSRIGLEPTWYIGAYAFTLNRLYAHALSHHRSLFAPEQARQKTARLMAALNKCVMIDMDMAISVYLDENKRSYEARLATLTTDFEANIGNIVGGVSAASTQLAASAEALVMMSLQTSESTESVAAASEQASANVAAVSSATEEMSASIANVSDMAQQSYRAADQASNETDRSAAAMGELRTAIEKVSEVTDLISEIANQTNLLALNATIEAARAGEAGKGFAVVASEVKTLATETAKATEDIQQKIADINEKSIEATSSLDSVKSVIAQTKDVSRGTAEAVDQQKSAVMEIARNIEEASAGTGEIARNTVTISERSQAVSDSAHGILEASKELARQSVALRDAVERFVQGVKAG